MKEKIQKLRRIISENPELAEYNERVEEDMNKKELQDVVMEIINDNQIKNQTASFNELQLLLNKYGENNPYPPKNF